VELVRCEGSDWFAPAEATWILGGRVDVLINNAGNFPLSVRTYRRHIEKRVRAGNTRRS